MCDLYLITNRKFVENGACTNIALQRAWGQSHACAYRMYLRSSLMRTHSLCLLSPSPPFLFLSLSLSLSPSLSLSLSRTHSLTQSQLPVQQSSSITVLIHFATSINSAQVIVAGTKGGHVTWFISQPPQKTYSILFSDQSSHAPHPIVALQVSGVCVCACVCVCVCVCVLVVA